MASRISEVMGLVDRARAVGWKVDSRKSGAIIIRCDAPDCPHGARGHTVHPGAGSDVATYQNNERELLRCGLADREEALATEDRVTRTALAKTAAALADKEGQRLAKLARERQRLAQAAGFTLLTTDNALGLVTPRGQVFKADIMLTPPGCRVLVEKLGGKNRKIQKAELRRWRDIILSTGGWRYTHQGLAINTKGELLDGQHRLVAIAGMPDDAGPFPIQLTVGLDGEVFSAIDAGKSRSPADALYAAGVVSNPKLVATVIRLVLAFRAGTWSTVRARHGLVTSTYEANEDAMEEAARAGVRIRHEIRRVSLAGAAGAWFLLDERVGDKKLLDQFWAGVLGQIAVDPSDVRSKYVKTLANRPVSTRASALRDMVLLIKTWNMFATGRDFKANGLTWRIDEGLPIIFVPPPPVIGFSG